MSNLPKAEDLIAYSQNAAGHEGMSSNASGSLIIKPCTQAEVDFYESAKDHELFQAHMPTYMGTLSLNQDQDVIPKLLVPHTDTFNGQNHNITGVKKTTDGSNTVASPVPADVSRSGKRTSWKPSGGKKLNTGLAIVLENAAAGFKHPNILDAKLGIRLWADDAPQAKRQKLDKDSRETTSGSLGFRVAGMRVWYNDDPEDSTTQQNQQYEIKDGCRFYGKHYGRAFTADTVKEAFVTFMGGADSDDTGKLKLKRKRGRLIAERLLRELESIQFVLENEESRMYSASVLIIYEGDDEALEEALRLEETQEHKSADEGQQETPTDTNDDGGNNNDDDDDDDDEEIEPKVLDVRLIDFAHAQWTPGLGPDENVLQGVRNLINMFQELVG